MGREARVSKARECPVCEGVYRFTAAEIQKHIAECRRLEAIGLVAPTLMQPHAEPLIVIP